MNPEDEPMPTHEARMRRIVGARTTLVVLVFMLAIMANTYWNAVHHGQSSFDRRDLRNDLEYNRAIVLEQRREIDVLKAESVEMRAEIAELRSKAGAPK